METSDKKKKSDNKLEDKLKERKLSTLDNLDRIHKLNLLKEYQKIQEFNTKNSEIDHFYFVQKFQQYKPQKRLDTQNIKQVQDLQWSLNLFKRRADAIRQKIDATITKKERVQQKNNYSVFKNNFLVNNKKQNKNTEGINFLKKCRQHKSLDLQNSENCSQIRILMNETENQKDKKYHFKMNIFKKQNNQNSQSPQNFGQALAFKVKQLQKSIIKEPKVPILDKQIRYFNNLRNNIQNQQKFSQSINFEAQKLHDQFTEMLDHQKQNVQNLKLIK